MTATQRLLASGLRRGDPLRVLAASGQLGYGIPEKAFRAGLARKPHIIGCDMGSIDGGPYYLGAGEFATSPIIAKRDLRLVLNGAREIDVPLIIGTAGTSGAAPHLAKTLDLIRTIAREDSLSFKLAVISADIPRDLLKSMVRAGRTLPLGRIEELTEDIVDNAGQIVGQMGVEAFVRALAFEPDVIIAGRACDTAIFAAVPALLGYDLGLAIHMAKIIECTSLCCLPGGRDAMLGTLYGDHFELESMNPDRAATPLSVAAHSLYEQGDPLTVYEPEGALHLQNAAFEAIDERRTKVAGAEWIPAAQFTVKIEGAEWVGERAVLCAASCDPKVIANTDAIIQAVRASVADIIPADEIGGSYDLHFHVYGKGGVSLFDQTAPDSTPEEIFFLVECIASTPEHAKSVISVCKQYLLHHGFAGRLSTGGNVAFPFTPPELPGGSAYRFSIYHVMECDDLAALFPIRIEHVPAETSAT